MAGSGNAFAEHLGVEQWGDAYWDVDHEAHVRYKVSLDEGVVCVLRPDGILGFVAPLDGFDKVASYLERLIVAREQPRGLQVNGESVAVGEFITPDENNLYYKQAMGQNLPESVEQGVVGKSEPHRRLDQHIQS